MSTRNAGLRKTLRSISTLSERFPFRKAFVSSPLQSGPLVKSRGETTTLSLGVGHTLRADVFQPHGGVHWAWFWRSLEAYDDRALWILRFLGRILSPAQWVSGWIEGAPCRQKEPPRVIAISDMVKEDIIRWYAIPEEKMTVIYNGVDLERFHPRNRRHRGGD